MATYADTAINIAYNLQWAIDEVRTKLHPMLEDIGAGKFAPGSKMHREFVKLHDFYCNLIAIRDGNFTLPT